MEPILSVILPTLGRPKRLDIAVSSLWSSTLDYEVECVVVTEEKASMAVATDLGCRVIKAAAGLTAVEKWNIGAAEAKGEWIALGADDLLYHKGWLEAALDANIGGFVGFNDVWLKTREFATHFMMTREFAIQHNGGCLAIPAYHSWFLDMETAERARRAGGYVWAAKSRVEHRHVDHGMALLDKTYQIGRKWHDIDQATFEKRKASGFPDDFTGKLSAISLASARQSRGEASQPEAVSEGEAL